MLQAGYLGTYCAEQFGPENVRGLRVRFLDRVWPDDVLTCSGTASEVAGEVVLELRMTRANGDVVITGSAIFLDVNV